MSWLSKLRKPNPNRKQLLFFSQDQLEGNYFAVVRISWFAAGRVCKVHEKHIYRSDWTDTAELSETVSAALRAGADVSVVCIATSEEVGFVES